MPAYSKPKNDISTHLNPMVFHPRFRHVSEKILKKMDMKTFKNCRQVSKSWQEFIDNQNILWMNENNGKDNVDIMV